MERSSPSRTGASNENQSGDREGENHFTFLWRDVCDACPAPVPHQVNEAQWEAVALAAGLGKVFTADECADAWDQVRRGECGATASPWVGSPLRCVSCDSGREDHA